MMHSPNIDRESRASRFLAAMDGLSRLMGGQVPGMVIAPEQMHGLLNLLADEAHEVVDRHEPAPRGAND